VIEILTALGIVIGLVAGGMQIWQHLHPRRKPEILNPVNGAECGGRKVELSGVVPRQRRRAQYWIAIQPNNSRGSGTWWPQRQSLTFGPRGTWVLQRATLGREGNIDIGVTFTVGLFEVLPGAQEKFSAMAAKGERLKLADVSDHCNHLHSIEVKRIA
jgi:hypothetical protein